MGMWQQVPTHEVLDFPGAGVAGSCEPPDMGDGNWSWMVHHSHLEKEQKVVMCLQHKSVMLRCPATGHDMKPVSHTH